VLEVISGNRVVVRFRAIWEALSQNEAKRVVDVGVWCFFMTDDNNQIKRVGEGPRSGKHPGRQSASTLYIRGNCAYSCFLNISHSKENSPENGFFVFF